LDKKTIHNNFEQIGSLQKNLGLLDDIDNKSLGELATIFPRSKFTQLEDESYFSMLQSLRDRVTIPEVIDESAPNINDKRRGIYGKQMSEAFNYAGKEFKLKDDIYEKMPSVNILDMDSPLSLNLIDMMDKMDREESLYGREIDIDEKEA
tara:strand:+ start:545 stop:994 length:450 start_codon:yes stop_codon:yes gene_type:complete